MKLLQAPTIDLNAAVPLLQKKAMSSSVLNSNIFRIFIECEAYKKLTPEMKNPVLIVAVQKGEKEDIQNLINAGADRTSEAAQEALLFVVSRGDAKIVDILLNKGANKYIEIASAFN